jgi:hypothetical protein
MYAPSEVIMRTSGVLAAVAGVLFGIVAVASMSQAPTASAEPAPLQEEESMKSNKLPAAYEAWRKAHEENGGDRNVDMAVRWHKALSSEQTAVQGTARLDLIEGSVVVALEGLEGIGVVDVWLVDNQDGEGKSVKPEQGDHFLYVGVVESDSTGKGVLNKIVGAELRKFEVDLLVVTRKDAHPAESGLSFGSLPLFQRLYSLDRINKSRPRNERSQP